MHTDKHAQSSAAAGRLADQVAAPAARSNAISRLFDHFAAHVTKWAGSSMAFGLALITVLIWAASGPAFGYSETWQLVINTGTTIVTFLMVFLIQQSQNKDAQALHLKLDDLLIALKGADEGLVDAERLDEDKLLAWLPPAPRWPASARKPNHAREAKLAHKPQSARRPARPAGEGRAVPGPRSLDRGPHDQSGNRVILPEHLMYPRQQGIQFHLGRCIERNQDGGAFPLAGHALDAVERRKPILQQKRPDVIVGSAVFDVIDQQSSHDAFSVIQKFSGTNLYGWSDST